MQKMTYNASLRRLEQVHLPHISWLFLTFFSFVSILEPTGLFQWKSHSALERINNIMTQSIPLQKHEYRSISGGVCSSPPISSCDGLHTDLARLIIVSPGVAGCRLSPKRFTHLHGHTPPAWWEILSTQGDGTASGQLSLISALPPTVLMRRWPVAQLGSLRCIRGSRERPSDQVEEAQVSGCPVGAEPAL